MWALSRHANKSFKHLPLLSLLARLEAVNNDHLDLALETYRPDHRRIECYHLVIRGYVLTQSNSFWKFCLKRLSQQLLKSAIWV